MTEPAPTLRRTIAAVTLAFGLVTACGNDASDSAADPAALELGVAVDTTDHRFAVTVVETTPNPLQVGPNALSIRLASDEGAAVDDLTVTVGGWMAAHGHGTNPAQMPMVRQGDGVYAADSVTLFMPGTWTLTVRITAADGTESEVAFDTTLES
ncbi:MAG: FixH family protein [Myxococcales bacterium]|nr:FixH family protein [Myxococcales bacterium]